MSSLNYYVSCEGETEQWYFDWLQAQINKDMRANKTVQLHPNKNRMPTDYAKSIQGAFSPTKGRCKAFYRVQDIEDYDNYHIEKFHSLCDNVKQARKITPNCEFNIAYSNFTFEVWVIAHKGQVNSVIDRDKYYQAINNVFGTQFINNADYKRESNFKKLLKQLSLNDVIDHALPECIRIRTANEFFQQKSKREYGGFTYYLNNPDTTVDIMIKRILHDVGIL